MGRVVVSTVSGVATNKLKNRVVLPPAASARVTCNVKSPVADGVPLITPVFVSMANPVSPGVTMDQR